DEARHFDRGIVWQRGDDPVVAQIAVDHRRLAGPHRVDDRGRILLGLLDLDAVGTAIFLAGALPVRDLLDTALGVFIERNAEFLDEFFTSFLEEVRRVYGEVLRAFGDEIAQPSHHLIAPLVGAARVPARLWRTSLTIGAMKLRIEVLIGPVRLAMLELE